jgi:hypothetical protein
MLGANSVVKRGQVGVMIQHSAIAHRDVLATILEK